MLCAIPNRPGWRNSSMMDMLLSSRTCCARILRKAALPAPSLLLNWPALLSAAWMACSYNLSAIEILNAPGATSVTSSRRSLRWSKAGLPPERRCCHAGTRLHARTNHSRYFSFRFQSRAGYTARLRLLQSGFCWTTYAICLSRPRFAGAEYRRYLETRPGQEDTAGLEIAAQRLGASPSSRCRPDLSGHHVLQRSRGRLFSLAGL